MQIKNKKMREKLMKGIKMKLRTKWKILIAEKKIEVEIKLHSRLPTVVIRTRKDLDQNLMK